MSEKPTKRPAHDVIMGKLEAAVAELEKFGPNTADRPAQVQILCDVLGEMVIPEKHREQFIVGLGKLSERCTQWGTVYTMLWSLVLQLGDEYAVEKEDA